MGVKEDAPLEVVIFNGGFGEEYAKAHEAMYKERYPKAEIKHSATQQISQTLQPRFVAGDPPDVVNNSGASQIDFNGLVSQGALADLGDLLAAPSLDDPKKTVKDTLLPGIVDVGSYDGKFLSLNYTYTAYGIWYSQKLFNDRGWQYPKTWDEMIALCRQIKATGIAPWTYQGKHSRYMSWPILSAAAKLGGVDVLKAIDNLEPNAWKHEAVRAAADAYYQTGRRRVPAARRRGHGPHPVADRVEPRQGRLRLVRFVAGERAEGGHPAGLPDGRRADAEPHLRRQAAVRGVPRHRRRAVRGAGQGEEPARRPGVHAGHAVARRAPRTSPARSAASPASPDPATGIDAAARPHLA